MSFLSEISQNAINAVIRFPVALSWSVLGSLILIGIYSADDFNIISQYDNLSLVLVLGVSWLIAIQFISEALQHKIVFRILLKASILAGLVGFYFYLEQPKIDNSDIGNGQWALLFLAGHVFVIFTPFINSWDKHRFWNYLKNIGIALIRSVLYSLVLFLGLALATAALEFLFDVELSGYIYLQIFIFCLGIINSFIFLSDFSLVKDLQKNIVFNKPIEVLVKYILIPLSLLYLVIVYVYALKILFTWELPRGWVTYLISALSVLAFIIHIVIEPVRQTHDSKLIKRFFPYYFYAILPLLPLLFIALYTRIADYNFTELRYLGLVLAIWIAGMLLYMILSKQKRLSLYAKTMFFLIILCTFGPLSAFKISLNAQLTELQKLLTEAKNSTTLSFDASQYESFKSIIRYIDNRNALEKTEAYFGFNPNEAFAETGNYRMPRKILDSLNIEILEDNSSDRIEKVFATKNYKIKPLDHYFNEEITEYTNYTILQLEGKIENQKALQLHFSENNIISMRYYGEALFETNLTSHLKTLGDTYDYLEQASPDEFTFKLKNEKGDFLMIFEEFSYSYENREVEIASGKAMLFYRTYEALELP